MSITVGQTPHFDISTVNFSPIGSTYLTGDGPGSAGSKIVILYGSSIGAKRKKIALRRYVYQYIPREFSIGDDFYFVATYKGARNRSVLPSYVGDTNDLNTRAIIHGTELPLETNPIHITQALLKDLFLYPLFEDYFFLDCSISVRVGASIIPKSKPNFLEIYRYGKLSKDDTTKVIAFKNNLINPRS